MVLRTDGFIARANEMVEHAFSFGGFVLLKQQDMFAMIDRIDGAIPEDVKEAERVLKRRDDIIANAKHEAERIVNDALNEKNRILSESELLRAVQQEGAVIREKLINECEEIKNKAYSDAEGIRMQVSEESRRMKDGIDNYAEQVLARLEENLETLSASLEQQKAVVKNGQMYLEQRKSTQRTEEANVSEYINSEQDMYVR